VQFFVFIFVHSGFSYSTVDPPNSTAQTYGIWYGI
jgi:hypothetical protein